MLVGLQIGSIGCGNGSAENGGEAEQELPEPCLDDHLEPND